MDITTLGIVGVAISAVYERVKQVGWPVWANQLLTLGLALVGAVLAPFILDQPWVASDVVGSFIAVLGGMQGTYVGGKMGTTAAHKALPHPTSRSHDTTPAGGTPP